MALCEPEGECSLQDKEACSILQAYRGSEGRSRFLNVQTAFRNTRGCVS